MISLKERSGNVFLGEYQHTLDEKNRIIIPSKFREDLGLKCIITKGLDGCLFIFPEAEWQRLTEKLNSLPLNRKDARAFTRFFLAGASELEKDKQGRIAVPGNLKEYADLGKDVMVIGVSNRLELWSQERWQAYQTDTEDTFEQLAELMDNFDLQL